MYVFVKTLTGKTITVDGLKDSNLVEDIKSKVLKAEGIPTDQQRYVQKSKKLILYKCICRIHTGNRNLKIFIKFYESRSIPLFLMCLSSLI